MKDIAKIGVPIISSICLSKFMQKHVKTIFVSLKTILQKHIIFLYLIVALKWSQIFFISFSSYKKIINILCIRDDDGSGGGGRQMLGTHGFLKKMNGNYIETNLIRCSHPPKSKTIKNTMA